MFPLLKFASKGALESAIIIAAAVGAVVIVGAVEDKKSKRNCRYSPHGI